MCPIFSGGSVRFPNTLRLQRNQSASISRPGLTCERARRRARSQVGRAFFWKDRLRPIRRDPPQYIVLLLQQPDPPPRLTQLAGRARGQARLDTIFNVRGSHPHRQRNRVYPEILRNLLHRHPRHRIQCHANVIVAEITRMRLRHSTTLPGALQASRIRFHLLAQQARIKYRLGGTPMAQRSEITRLGIVAPPMLAVFQSLNARASSIEGVMSTAHSIMMSPMGGAARKLHEEAWPSACSSRAHYCGRLRTHTRAGRQGATKQAQTAKNSFTHSRVSAWPEAGHTSCCLPRSMHCDPYVTSTYHAYPRAESTGRAYGHA